VTQVFHLTEWRKKPTDRNGLGKLEHLLRHLMLVLLSRDHKYALHGMCLLPEAEEDDFCPYVQARSAVYLLSRTFSAPCGLILCNLARKTTG